MFRRWIIPPCPLQSGAVKVASDAGTHCTTGHVYKGMVIVFIATSLIHPSCVQSVQVLTVLCSMACLTTAPPLWGLL